MKTIRKTFISACLLSLIFIFAAFAPIGVKAADATIYDISDIVEKIGARKEYEMKHGVKEVSGTALGYGDTVKFAYKERSDKNTDGHYSRTAFGIGSYGFYFYHTSGDIQVRICNMQTDARNWDRSNSYFDTIPDNTFRTYGEITFTAALKTGDENTVVLTLVYPGGKVSKEFAKQDSSDMLFRFGDHDVDGNFVKSLAPKTDNENPVITVLVAEFRVPVGSYPAADAFTATVSGTDDDITVEGATLVLEDTTEIKLYFTCADLTGKAFKVGNSEVTPEAVTGVENCYVLRLKNIVMKDIDELYDFTLGGKTVRYGALSYVKATLEDKDTSISLGNLVKALYELNVAANAYFAA